MEVIVIPTGEIQENCYIAADFETKQALIIDPGDDHKLIEGMLHSLGLKLVGVLLTHAHYDHIGALDALMENWPAPVYLNPAEIELLEKPTAQSAQVFSPVKTKLLPIKEGVNQIGDFQVEAYYAPGHSIGSTMYRIGQDLFTGDVLFQGSIGRIDFPTGDADAMKASLEMLKNMKENYIVYPGHGPSTTLNFEKSHNPFFLYPLS